MINLKQNGSGQNINLSPIYHQIEVLDENTVLLSRRIDTIQTGTIDLSDIENSISSLNNNMVAVQSDITNIKSNTSILSNDIETLKTDLSSNISVISTDLIDLSSKQFGYYESDANMITDIKRNFIYNFRDSKYSAFKTYKVYNGLMDINNTSFLGPNMTFNCVDLVNNEFLCMSNGRIKCSNLSSCSFKFPYMNIEAYSAVNNSLCGTLQNYGLDAKFIKHENNSYSSFQNLNLNVIETASSNVFNKIKHLNLKGYNFVSNTFTTCECINCNCYNVDSNSLKNVRYLNYIGKSFGNNTYINQSDYPYQCQFMNAAVEQNSFAYPAMMNITCKNINSNTVSNAVFVDVKCSHLISNEFNNVRFLKIHNVDSSGYGTYSAIGDFYLENFKTKTNEAISNVTRFRFNNGSTNLYDTNLNWTLTNTNYDFVESNVVHCGDFNPIPYIRSINKHLESIETKLTQSTSPESDVFVKKINVPGNIAVENTTFSSANSLKINCIDVRTFKCSDIKSLKINGSNLESGMFSNIKYVEINALNCDKLTFDNVEYIKVSCTNTPNIYCSNIGTIKLNNYDKIQLQKFNLFEAPHPNSFFNEQYIKGWNVNTSSSNPYDGHFMSDYTPTNDKTYGNVKFKFNVDSFTQLGYTTVIQFEQTIVVEYLESINRLLTWNDDTFKMCHSYESMNSDGQKITYFNYLRNYQIQFDMPYVITSTVSHA